MARRSPTAGPTPTSSASPRAIAVRRTRHSDSPAVLAAEAWRHLFDFIVTTGHHRTRALGVHDLTPNDARALHGLDAKAGRTMSSLATEWNTDASYATAIVDRLAQRGLVERRDDPADRRVKLVVLTRVGAKLVASLGRAIYRPPPELMALSARELAALAKATRPLARTKGIVSVRNRVPRGS